MKALYVVVFIVFFLVIQFQFPELLVFHVASRKFVLWHRADWIRF